MSLLDFLHLNLQLKASCGSNPLFLTNGNQILTVPLFHTELQIWSNSFRAKPVKTLNLHACFPAYVHKY